MTGEIYYAFTYTCAPLGIELPSAAWKPQAAVIWVKRHAFLIRSLDSLACQQLKADVISRPQTDPKCRRQGRAAWPRSQYLAVTEQTHAALPPLWHLSGMLCSPQTLTQLKSRFNSQLSSIVFLCTGVWLQREDDTLWGKQRFGSEPPAKACSSFIQLQWTGDPKEAGCSAKCVALSRVRSFSTFSYTEFDLQLTFHDFYNIAEEFDSKRQPSTSPTRNTGSKA